MRIIVSLLLFGATIITAGYITPPLQAVLDTLSPGNKTWISVHLKERPNLARFPQRAYAEKIAYLREFSQRTQRPLIDFANAYGNQIDSLKSFWVYNGFCLKATKPVILALAGRPEVDFVNGGETGEIEQGPSGYAPPPPQREWNIERVGAHLVWLDGYTGDGIVVCIFDSGMLINHESYGSNTNWKWRNEYDWPNAWFDTLYNTDRPHDPTGHGTHVGGIAIGGDGVSGGLRDIGVAPGAKLIACLGGTDGGDDVAHACFQWIAGLVNTPYGNLAPDVVNCSWGDRFNMYNLEFWDDVCMLRNLGIIPIFCIGNTDAGGGWPNWPPGNFPITIGVGATDIDDWASDFSGHGLSPTNPPWSETQYWSRPDWNFMGVDIMAPGTKYGTTEGIYSADKNDPHGYIWMWGTSQATPHVTGAIALMQEAAIDNFGHKLDYYDIYDILIDAADTVGQNVPNYNYGWGRLDCKVAVDSVLTFRMKSSSPHALAYNNQHKLVYDAVNSRFHFVYQSGQDFEGRGKYIRYTNSVDGENWSVDQKLGDGDAPTIAVDANGNLHCVYRDGNAIMYQRIINGIPDSPKTLFIDLFALDIGVPAFVIFGNTGYVAFELYNQWMQSCLLVGSFDITSANPVLQYTNLESTTEYRFGAPALCINSSYGLVVTYARKINGVFEVYYRASGQNWRLVLVSRNDGIKSVAPVVVSANGLWFFWEDGEPADIYYRWRTNQWQNQPSPVYVSVGANSYQPRAVVHSVDPSKLYVVWSEQTDAAYNVYASAYYGGWQSPTIISSSAVWSMNPDLVYAPDGLIEGRMLITYSEGNERWLSRHPYLPLYRVCTYQSVLPLVPGGPQDKETMSFDSGNLSLEVYPNPFQNQCVIKFQIPSTKFGTNSKSQIPNNFAIRNPKSEISIRIYDVSGRLVKDLPRLTVNGERSTVVWDGEDNLGRNLSPGVYFVQIKAGAYQQIEKVVLCK